MYESAHSDVLRFVQRRAGPDAAEDITHEAFLVAWRRFEDAPAGRSDARAWLFGIARNCLLSDQRGQVRRGALGIRIAADTTTAVDAEDDLSALRLDLKSAWQKLRPDQQEILSLAIWDELDSTHAGQVLGITAASYRIRLHRARAALRRLLDATPFSAPAAVLTASE
ncbi:RNA polymerase sigma factor [Rathayibacter sp. AY1D3]|uniref:RNA polymerase sigma factor n=1 Tax=Rathayibacter sp. AY1D3 TaxID=2080544 RepID=UPI0021588E89|nr:sigma-70 family RNA polymerase sigma factor [Rathayibacter sp. AY1D3]